MATIEPNPAQGSDTGDLLAQIQAIIDAARRAGRDLDEQAALDEIARLLPARRPGEIYQKPLG